MVVIEEVDCTKMQKLVANGAMLVDVREDDEVEAGSIDGMVHMPLSRFDEFKDAIPQDREIVFYCRSGKRSLKACEFAAQCTSQKVYSLAGGYLAWQAEQENN